MAEELKTILWVVDELRLPETIKALEYFKREAEFRYPLNDSDSWAFKGKRQEMEAVKSEMEVLHRAELVIRDKVSCVVPFKGDVMIYELSKRGKGIYEKLFNEEPKMCSSKHYATTH